MDSAPVTPPAPPAALAPGRLERVATDRLTYLAVFGFLLLYVFSVRGIEAALDRHFKGAVAAAARVEPGESDPAVAIAARVDALLRGSLWVRPGGVRVDALVVGADGRTLLYAGGGFAGALAPGRAGDESPARLLPPLVDVSVAVPHNALAANAVLIGYAGGLLAVLFANARRAERREAARLAAAAAEREAAAQRAARIETELAAARDRLHQAEAARASGSKEVRELEGERAQLLARLAALEEREASLRGGGADVEALREEQRALEELLEEAAAELRTKEEAISTLRRQVKKQERADAAPARRADQLAARLRALYKNLEVDERVVEDLIGLRDETLALRAEESLKRLSDDPDQAQVRRKVGGLPPHLSIFELGFAGGGRIYFTKGRVRRHRILLVGTKATQKPDLEFLSRLPKE
jgi:hypothetical protein